MELIVLSAADVARCLPMVEAIRLMRAAFSQWSAGKGVMPHRVHVDTPDGTMLVMPSYLSEGGELCVKIVSVFEQNAARGLPVISGLAVVLDDKTGRPRAVLDAHSLTAIRTGAAGGLAADVLARPDASRVALFGAGDQAREQLRAVLAVRQIEHVSVRSRSEATARRLVDEVKSWPDAPAIEWMHNVDESVRSAHIVVTATTSASPVISGESVQPGTHVTAIGSYKPHVREVDAGTVRKSRVIVDSRAAALAEAGDLIQAGVQSAVEIGEILNGTAAGRVSPTEITLFKSVGLAVQDAAAAHFAVQQAARLGLGTRVNI